MTHRLRTRTFSLAAVLVLALLLAACHPAPATAEHAVTDSWTGGYTASLTLTNTGDATLTDWRLRFVLADDITNLWNAELVDRTAVEGGWAYTVAGPTWQPDLDAGAALAIGWTATPAAGTPGVPADCALDGSPIHCTPAGGAATTTTTAPPMTSTTPPPTTTTPPPTGGPVDFAPYLDVTLWPPPDLDGLAADRGLELFTLAFLVTGEAACAPAWGGVIPLADDHLGAEVDELRAAGSDVIVSFGGALGTELAQSCGTVDALAAAYQAAIDPYGLTGIDVDVEGGALADHAANDRRSAALARLQADAAAAGRSLEVSLTLPVLPAGLTADGLEVVRSALEAGVDLAAVNIMAMDYGSAAAPDPDGRMGQYAIDAATATHAQLGTLLAERTDAERWAMIGVTPMIGQNDVAGEIFWPADADQLASFAGQVGVGRLSMWSVTRDAPCPGGPSPWASATCSGIDQEPGRFGEILAGG